MMSDNPYAATGADDQGAEKTIPSSPGKISVLGWAVRLVVFGGIGLLLIAFFLPAFNRGPEPARRSQCKNNLKQIMLALHNYHDEWESFPPAYTVDADGNRLHSWRTLILPYMDQLALYDSIDLSKPWNDPVNEQARKTRVSTYECPSTSIADNLTTYLGVNGTGFFFDGTHSRTLQEIKDGSSNTLAVIDVDSKHAVEWMSPEDADEQLILQFGPETKLSHTGGFHASLADGSVRFLPTSLPAEQRKALMTIDANDSPGEF